MSEGGPETFGALTGVMIPPDVRSSWPTDQGLTSTPIAAFGRAGRSELAKNYPTLQ